MLYWETVTDALKGVLIKLMPAEQLQDFRLVGGTALSLYWGHRLSVDIDLFTDAPYGSIDFDTIETFLKNNFDYVQGNFGGNAGMGKSYLVGADEESATKLDIYYSMDPFVQPLNQVEGIRLASVEEIIAMKVDVIQRGGRKKDFWDLHEAFDKYSINDMLALHKQRFEWTHDVTTIRKNFLDFTIADNDFDPICLKNKEWAFIKEDIESAVSS